MPIAHTDIVCAEVTLRQTYSDANLGAKVIQNVFHYRRRDYVVAPNKEQLADAFNDNHMAELLASQSENIISSEIGVRYVNDPDDAVVFFPADPTGPGGVAVDALPPQNAVTFLLKTGLKGRKHRGFKRFGGVADTHVTRGWLNDTGLALWDALRDVLPNILTESTTGETWSLAVWNRVDSDLSSSPGITVLNDVTQITINRNIGSQDSRRQASSYA